MKRVFEGYFLFALLAIVAGWIASQADEEFFVRLLPRKTKRIEIAIPAETEERGTYPEHFNPDEVAGGPGTTAANGTDAVDPNGLDEQLVEFAGNPRPDYPLFARKKGWEGDVTISAKLNPDGSTKELKILESSGYPALDQAALKAESRARYQTPKEWNFGRPLRRTYLFRLTGAPQKLPGPKVANDGSNSKSIAEQGLF